MNASTKAVFLSYASQDAEAAKRICDALRSGGVEVWLDAEGGLEQGDEWDAKIRRQIKECVLFVPIISANTQSRLEGYFRLEWDLAAERVRTIASGVPFILPVVIDDTREPDAFVPDRFRTVQWTRLPGGVVPPEVLQRFLKLWSHRIGVVSHESAVGASLSSRQSLAEVDDDARGRRQAAPLLDKSRSWLLPAIVGVLAFAALAIWQPWKGNEPKSVAPANSPAPASEAQQLVAKAWVLMNRPDMAREELVAADVLCKQAAALDPNDLEVWAAWSFVDAWYCYHAFDNTPERREGARSKAARALNLAPSSYEARLAQANYLVREGSDAAVSLYAPEADRLLRALLQERPTEPRALLTFAILQRNLGHAAEARQALETMARDPASAALAWHELSWVERRNGDPTTALELEDRSIALQAGWLNLTGKMQLLMDWQGDLDAAKVVLDRIPARAMQEDYTASVAMELLYRRRTPDALLRLADSIPRDWLQSNIYLGPLGWWKGQAEQQAGHPAAARVHWQAARQLVERRLAETPSAPALIAWKSRLLAVLGETAEAEKTLQLARELGAFTYAPTQWIDEIRLGQLERVLDEMESEYQTNPGSFWAAQFRFSPEFDPLREQPRFITLLEKMEADPRCSPKARPAAALPVADREQVQRVESAPRSSLLATPSDKSVAVLAFANLSDDKDNEYFSDGISEELLNVLAKIPGLKVTARTSAFFFKGKQVPIADIAQKLGVAYVVEGSVRKQGDRVRVTAQLIKAEDGFPLWSERFDRDLKDIFAVQDEIAGRIARELSSRLGVATGAVSGTGGTKSVEAYEAFLKGRAAWSQRTYSSNQEAVRYFQQAIALDPGYALAHGALAEGYVTLSINGVEPADKVFPLAKASAERALELDPNIVQAYTALAEYYFHYARDYEESDREIERALAVDPNYAVAYSRYSGHLICRNRLEEALAMDERSIALNPLGPEATNSWTLVSMKRYDEALESARRESAPDRFPMSGRQTIGLIQFLTGHGEEAVKTLEGVVRDFPEETDPLTYLGWVYGQVGQTAKAREILQRMMAMSESRYVSPLEMAKVAAGMNDREQAFAQLERAFERREPELPTIGASRFFDPIRDDPRFREMLKRLKLDVFFPETTKK